MTMYESNSEVGETGAEVAEFVDAPPAKETPPAPLAPETSQTSPAPSRSEHPVAPGGTYLRIYLNDHRAAAQGGVSLAVRCQRNNRGTPLGDELESIVRDVRADEESLTRIAEHLAVPENRFKQTAVRAGEWVGRLKFNGEIRKYSDLSRLLELEALLAGIDGKRSLWRALSAAGTPVPAGIDLRQLEDRASDQRARLRPHHRAAAQVALIAGETAMSPKQGALPT